MHLKYGVNVIFKCDCGKIAEGKDTLERGFRSFSGRSWGVGRVVPLNTVDEITPDGWWAFDPYTHLCYCPECRAKIEATDPVEVAEEKTLTK